MARVIGNRGAEEEKGNDGSMTQLRTMPQGAKRRGQTILQTHVPTHTHAHFCQGPGMFFRKGEGQVQQAQTC